MVLILGRKAAPKGHNQYGICTVSTYFQVSKTVENCRKYGDDSLQFNQAMFASQCQDQLNNNKNVLGMSSKLY